MLFGHGFKWHGWHGDPVLANGSSVSLPNLTSLIVWLYEAISGHWHVVYHGISWWHLVYHGISWYCLWCITVYRGISWYSFHPNLTLTTTCTKKRNLTTVNLYYIYTYVIWPFITNSKKNIKLDTSWGNQTMVRKKHTVQITAPSYWPATSSEKHLALEASIEETWGNTACHGKTQIVSGNDTFIVLDVEHVVVFFVKKVRTYNCHSYRSRPPKHDGMWTVLVLVFVSGK